jgi:hypothetical protein
MEIETMKKAYTVKGSEDGTLAVTSNRKAAYRVAVGYLSQYASNAGGNRVSMTYTEVCAALRDQHNSCAIEGDGLSVEIEVFCLLSS